MDSRTVRCRGILEGEECGAALQRRSKFCNDCGNPIDPNIWKEEPPLVCTGCGWEAPPGSKPKFCSECGTKLGTGKYLCSHFPFYVKLCNIESIYWLCILI